MRLFFFLASLLFSAAAMAADATSTDEVVMTPAQPAITSAIFAGGCFWCMQPAFDNTPGVLETRVGYTGGTVANPTYEQVTSGTTGHVEAIEITYDANRVSYERLLDIYWENVDPTDAEGQFADKGNQYRTAIFTVDGTQKAAAETSKAMVAKKFAPTPIATVILPAQPFYPAEDYHQKYYQKNSTRYTMYKYGSGRAAKLERLWGDGEKK